MHETPDQCVVMVYPLDPPCPVCEAPQVMLGVPRCSRDTVLPVLPGLATAAAALPARAKIPRVGAKPTAPAPITYLTFFTAPSFPFRRDSMRTQYRNNGATWHAMSADRHELSHCRRSCLRRAVCGHDPHQQFEWI